MAGEKDRNPDAPSKDVGVDGGDTTTWRRGVAPPRIPKEPSPSASSEIRSVSQSAETVVTESGSTTPSDLDLSLTADGSSPVAPILFERIEPSAMRGETIRLDPRLARIRVGRSETNEFRLHSASTSRKHAVIERDFTGRWVLTPLAGKSVKVDGYPMTESVVLEPGMNLVLGGDHLRCLPGEAIDAQGSAVPVAEEHPAVESGLESLLTSKPMLAGAALLGMGVGVLVWLLG